MALKLIGNTFFANLTANTVQSNYARGATFLYCIDVGGATANITVGSNSTVQYEQHHVAFQPSRYHHQFEH
jgi:hypothetical protein